MKRLSTILCFLLLLLLCSCNFNGKTEKDLYDLINRKVVFPHNKMKQIKCSMFTHTSHDKTYKLLNIVDYENCLPCIASTMKNFETSCSENDCFDKIAVIHVVIVPHEKMRETINQLRRERIQNDVYIDTCNVFMTENRKLSEHPEYRMMLLDNSNKIMMVGNPFKNSKMNVLLHKIVNNEIGN